ncbi:hypothetical protein ACFQJ5_18870 [Halomicroarcula sp. GCM10025324]|uniref:hypothetical protein n=1 Tax=Halomicroarcula sp. GCM10025324 TaxID=3252667 RepID=UPI00361F61DF
MSTNTESTADAQPEDDIDNLEIEADPEDTVEENVTDTTIDEDVDGEDNIDGEPVADLTDEQDTSEESIAETSDELMPKTRLRRKAYSRALQSAFRLRSWVANSRISSQRCESSSTRRN